MISRERINQVIQENERRLAAINVHFDPVTGEGSLIQRKRLTLTGDLFVLLPVTMYAIPWVRHAYALGSLEALAREACRKQKIRFKNTFYSEMLSDLITLRLDHDFEYWAYLSVKIIDKKSGMPIPFKLNLPQRELVAVLEQQRTGKKPIRVVIVKARQWGGSTVTQIYYSWIQIRLKTNWNSVIVTDVENQARNIRSMFTRLAESYPIELADDPERPLKLIPFEGSSKTRQVRDRENIIDISSTESPESTRGFDYALCHLSEVGLWKGTLLRKPEDMVQNIRGGVKKGAYSAIVMESTAKGVGNFFHREWIAAKTGKSGYYPFFMPWHKFADYLETLTIAIDTFIISMDDDDWTRWEQGATLEGINWYRNYMRSENMDKWRMESEFPGDDIEAFQSTGTPFFHRKYVQMLRKSCRAPLAEGNLFADAVIGNAGVLRNIRFEASPKGLLSVWEFPDKSIVVKNRYIVSVDIGGTTDEADYSTINVLDRYWLTDGGKLTRVATWRGHIDQDLLAWIAMQVAEWYNHALLVVESNSLKKDERATEGDHFLTVLDKLAEFYDNIYTRTSPERVIEGAPRIYGFHTNRQTKPLALSTMRAMVRDERYEERDERCCDEMDTFQVMDDGSMGAVDGSHDDIIMPTSIGAHISECEMPPPVEIKQQPRKNRYDKMTGKKVSESTF